jgi:LPXTG-motif cell wall-anchored protein
MLRRVLLTAAAVVTVSGVWAAPAGAGGNYGGCSATVSDSTPSAGQLVTVSGSGASDGGSVSATLDEEQIGTGTADSQGDFSFEATIPSDASGTETLAVSCGTGNGVFPLTITVAGAEESSDAADLPSTGSSSTVPMALVGLGALAGGTVLVGVARKRSHTA